MRTAPIISYLLVQWNPKCRLKNPLLCRSFLLHCSLSMIFPLSLDWSKNESCYGPQDANNQVTCWLFNRSFWAHFFLILVCSNSVIQTSKIKQTHTPKKPFILSSSSGTQTSNCKFPREIPLLYLIHFDIFSSVAFHFLKMLVAIY